MMCLSAVACSGSVQVLSVDRVSHFHTVGYKLTAYAMQVSSNILELLVKHCCICIATMHSVCVLELHVAVSCT